MFKTFFSILFFCVLNLGISNSLLASSSDSNELIEEGITIVPSSPPSSLESGKVLSEGSDEKDRSTVSSTLKANEILIEEDYDEEINILSVSSSLEGNEIFIEEDDIEEKLRKFFKKFKSKKLGYKQLTWILDSKTGAFNSFKGSKNFMTKKETDLSKIKKRGVKGTVFQYWARSLRKLSTLPPEDECSIIFLRKKAKSLARRYYWGLSTCYPYVVEGMLGDQMVKYAFCLLELPMQEFSRLEKRHRHEIGTTIGQTRDYLTGEDRRKSGSVFDVYGLVGMVLDDLDEIYGNTKKYTKKLKKHQKVLDKKSKKKNRSKKNQTVNPKKKVKSVKNVVRTTSCPKLEKLTFKKHEEVVRNFKKMLEDGERPQTNRDTPRKKAQEGKSLRGRSKPSLNLEYVRRKEG
jgi:hypothetical protein